MKSSWILALGLWAGMLPVAVQAASGRNPTPEGVSVFAAAGYLSPSGRFGDRVDGGPLFAAGGFYRLNDYVAPAFALQYAVLEPSSPIRGSLDTWDALGGLRVFLLPGSIPIRPWVTALGGWAHYTTHRHLDLEPVIGRRRANRDDGMLSLGGGVNARLHPQLEIGIDGRHNVSYTDDREKGERDIRSVSILGTLVFNY